jgi:hypothetical protein
MQLTPDGPTFKKPGVTDIRGDDGWYTHQNIAQFMVHVPAFDLFCCSACAFIDVCGGGVSL